MQRVLKLVRVTTADISLLALLRGQIGFLNQELEVAGVSATGLEELWLTMFLHANHGKNDKDCLKSFWESLDLMRPC